MGTNAVPNFDHDWGMDQRLDGADFTLTVRSHAESFKKYGWKRGERQCRPRLNKKGITPQPAGCGVMPSIDEVRSVQKGRSVAQLLADQFPVLPSPI